MTERPDDGTANGVFPLFEHTHDTLTTAAVVGFAAAIGLLAGWLAADFGGRFTAFLVGAVGAGYLLYRQPTRRAVLAAGLYSVAALLAVTPVVYELQVVVSVPAPQRHVLATSDLLLVVVLWVVAAVPAVVGYRLASGPFLPRLRERLGR